MKTSTIAVALAAAIPVTGPITWWATETWWGFVIPAFCAIILVIAESEGMA